MTRENVTVKPGHQYDQYFPEAKVGRILKKRNAKVSDTLKLIPMIIRETAWQTRRFAHEVIKAETLEKTCSNLWHFVYDHIAYKKDETGKEQVRDAARIWHDRHNVDPVTGEPMGVDCDCMTTFICSVLYNLEVNNVYFRVTRYEEPHWEHIYPVIKLPGGKEIIIDCVLHHFNQEAKYTAKQDTAMDLEYLNGVTDSTLSKLSDAPDLMGIMDEQEALSALGKIFKKKASGGGGGGAKPGKKGLFKKKAAGAPKKPLFKKKTPEQKKANKAKVKKFIGKGLHVTNRINPVTVALRNGVLAGMKLNFLKIAENLRWAYLTPEQAQAKGADMSKYQKLKGVREKLEKIFHGAGGKPENLKKSILTGRGNRDKAVPLNGLGYISYENVDGLNEDMPLNQLLGHEIYYSENVQGLEGLDGFEGLEGFGEDADLGAATAASVAAASTVLTTIAGLIKSIGSLFPGKTAAKGGASKKDTRKSKKAAKRGGGENFSDKGGSGSEESAASEEGSGGDESSSEGGDEGGGDPAAKSGGGEEDSGSGDEGASASEEKGEEEGSGEDGSTNGNTESAAAKGGDSGGGSLKATTVAKAKLFWENNKKWIKPTGIAVGVLGLVYLTHRLLKSNSTKKPALGLTGIGNKQKRKPQKKKNILSGIRSKKGGKRPASRNHKKRKVITLL